MFAANRRDWSAELEKTADEMESALLKKLALQMPLQGRNFVQARKKWQELRESDLSLEALHEFEATLAKKFANKWR